MVQRGVQRRPEAKDRASWFDIESTTPEKVRPSSQQRRDGSRADVFQAERELRYYDKNLSPGTPIQQSWNFDLDIPDGEFSVEYDDTPPRDGKSSRSRSVLRP
jgi:hypothetical protein